MPAHSLAAADGLREATESCAIIRCADHFIDTYELTRAPNFPLRAVASSQGPRSFACQKAFGKAKSARRQASDNHHPRQKRNEGARRVRDRHAGTNSNADRAIAFYAKVFGAAELERLQDDASGRVVHSLLSIHGSLIGVIDEDRESGNFPPNPRDGSPVILQLEVDDPDGMAAIAEQNGAEVLIPVDGRFYGRRDCRLKDPFGHLWVIGKPL